VTGQSCRRKSRNFERRVQRRLAQVFGEDVVQRGAQVGGTADVTAPGLWIECKARRRTNPRAALRQARSGVGEQCVRPVAVCKDDRKPPLVMMTFEDFVDLLRELHALRFAA